MHKHKQWLQQLKPYFLLLLKPTGFKLVTYNICETDGTFQCQIVVRKDPDSAQLTILIEENDTFQSVRDSINKIIQNLCKTEIFVDLQGQLSALVHVLDNDMQGLVSKLPREDIVDIIARSRFVKNPTIFIHNELIKRSKHGLN